MKWLNEKVPYRYSGIFAFDDEMLRNLCLVDKEDPSVTRTDDLPITNSYCFYVQRAQSKFSVEEAISDERVDGHPKQKVVQCYYGIPLLGEDGKLRGTVCHFDSAPIRVTEDVVTVLDDLAHTIAKAAFR